MRSKKQKRDRLGLVIAVLVVAALACSLSTDDGTQTKSTPLSSPLGPVPTYTPIITLTPLVTLGPTPTGQALPDSNQVPPTQANCTPQTAWPVYTVIDGDILSLLAERCGTSVQALVTANCLSNPELIYIGQKLYVPVLPAPLPTNTPQATLTPIPTTDPNQPIFKDSLTVQPFWMDSNNRAVTNSETVRLNTGEVLNATRVVFYVDDPGGGADISVGQDDDPWDGAFVDYSFPAPGSYTFKPVAENETSKLAGSSFTIRYDPGYVPPGGQRNLLTFTPSQPVSGGYRLTAGTTVTITWPDAPIGALKIDFVLTPSSGAEQIIGTDQDATNGGAIAWAVPTSLSGSIQARATMPGGAIQSSEAASVTTQ